MIFNCKRCTFAYRADSSSDPCPVCSQMASSSPSNGSTNRATSANHELSKSSRDNDQVSDIHQPQPARPASVALVSPLLEQPKAADRPISRSRSEARTEVLQEDPAVALSQRQLIALAGAALLLFGIFAPIVTLPIVGSMNYFQNGKGDGTIIGALALATAFFSLKKQYTRLWWTGGASAALMLVTFVIFQRRMSDLKSSMGEELQGNPFRGLVDMAVGSIQLSWGWVVLVLGLACVFYAAKSPSVTRR